MAVSNNKKCTEFHKINAVDYYLLPNPGWYSRQSRNMAIEMKDFGTKVTAHQWAAIKTNIAVIVVFSFK